ncbi:hypothetical protein [Mycolicibacterium hodleri]|uniref:hypothetical protein n=1 Tax=Mycolicibacterium hodleri TaxID=49897 RepID=UPI001476FAAA|nr:hypothetical protein [Mycolicibacterium hodleri]
MRDQALPDERSVNAIFGDSLPETTKDERDYSPFGGEADRDEWLRENVPPHHG